MSECQICGPMFIGKCPHKPDTNTKAPRDSLADAESILEEYVHPHSQIDLGNLYFAAKEYRSAYLEVVKELERSYAEVERFKAARDSRLKSDIEQANQYLELRKERDELRKENERYSAAMIETRNRASNTIAQLQAKCAGLREALEFYAQKSVWGNGCAAIDPCDTYECELSVLRGGKRAREALEKFK